MKSEKNNADYSIILSQLRIARLLGHNLLVLKDNSGKLISEIDGLATSKNGGGLLDICLLTDLKRLSSSLRSYIKAHRRR